MRRHALPPAPRPQLAPGHRSPPAALARRPVLRTALAAVAGGLLAGCGPQAHPVAAPAARPRLLTVPFQLYVVSIPLNATSTRLIQEFVDTRFNARHKGIRAVFTAPFNLQGVVGSILAGSASRPWVVASCCADWVTILPFLERLDPWLHRDNVNPTLWTAGQLARFQTPQGLYGLPEDAACEAYLYRQDILDELGLPYPSPDWTSAEAASLWQACTGTKGGRHRYGTQFPWGPHARCGGALVGFPALVQGWPGGAFISADGRRCLLDRPGSVAAGEYFFQQTWDGVAAPGTCGSPTPLVFTGQAVFAQGAEPTILQAVQRLGGSAKWDFVPYPRLPAGRIGVLHDNFYGMVSGVPNQELAWELLRFAAVEPEWSRFYMGLSLSPPSLPSLLQEWMAILRSVAPVLKNKALEAWTAPTLAGEGRYDFEFFRYDSAGANAALSRTWPLIWNRQLDVTGGFRRIAQDVDAVVRAGETAAGQRSGAARSFPSTGPGIAHVVPGL